ncbi:MAG: nitrile hydratase subunit beta [Bryobacteraceae bacterium]
MNGVHDMGGAQGMGRIEYERNEPVFHAPWEGRVFAMVLAAAAWRKWSLDMFRHQIERIPPIDYLRMSYYEKWLTAVTERLVESGLISRAELESGTPAPGSSKETPALTAGQVPSMLRSGALASRAVEVVPRFHPGQPVRTRNIHPTGHTRLPRYARDKQGVIERNHGVYVFPDTTAHSLGEKAQHVYSVRFMAPELWGPEASPRDSVNIDLWDNYLEPA